MVSFSDRGIAPPDPTSPPSSENGNDHVGGFVQRSASGVKAVFGVAGNVWTKVKAPVRKHDDKRREHGT